ncbi:hypothetical protein F0562_012613 [Nyssa sinensis]|uniref:Smr domain-containing protein n=1 Tax=Nyssa sinensis TaxID=561372 RepID=A0A5J4ZTG2_9ASTE|nr:hypothetical protein F0562_012613 [Nyssa sinensis]
MAATPVSTALDVRCSIPHPSETKRPIFFTSPLRLPTKRFTISCTSSKTSFSKSPPKPPPNLEQQSPSLSDQLKPLSTTILSDAPKKDEPPQTHLLAKPKSTWVNPTKPKRSVLSLQRHKRSPYSYNPQIRDLKLFARKLNDCDTSEGAFTAVLGEIPHPLTRENALLVLNSLRPWQKTHLFFNWIKTQNLFPIETIFYNVTMKSLRFGRQFQLIEDLANDMINNDVDLDNITYSTIITCAKRCNLFDKAVEWFERMYKTGLMPDEVTYSAILDVYAKLGKVEEVMSLYERGRASGWKPDGIAFAVLAKMYGEAGDYDGIRYVLQEMKSLGVQPNLVVFNTLLEAMGKAGKPGLARSLFEEMVNSGINPDEKTLTALVKIYGKASKQTRNWLPSSNCLKKRKLGFETVKDEFRGILSDTAVESRRPFCNCLIDICRNRNLHERAHELLYTGTIYGLYPGLHTKTAEEWRLNVRSLSVGAAHTALEEWMGTLTKIVKRQEALPELFSVNTGAGTHKFSQGLASAFASHAKKLAAPFRESEERAGFFLATREELVSWVQSRVTSLAVTA